MRYHDEGAEALSEMESESNAKQIAVTWPIFNTAIRHHASVIS